MENEARGKNFIITPTEAQIFHVSSYQDGNGEWWYRDRFAYDRDVQVEPIGSMQNIERYLSAAERAGKLSEAKMIVVKPMAALVLYAMNVIPIERFQEATERSSSYFDIPGSELNTSLPIRIAHHPTSNFRLTDERGYSVYAG